MSKLTAEKLLSMLCDPEHATDRRAVHAVMYEGRSEGQVTFKSALGYCANLAMQRNVQDGVPYGNTSVRWGGHTIDGDAATEALGKFAE